VFSRQDAERERLFLFHVPSKRKLGHSLGKGVIFNPLNAIRSECQYWEAEIKKRKLLTMTADMRWKQRYENFSKAFGLLDEALKNGPGSLNQLEREGVIQRFEYTFELAWKTVKDYLENAGVVFEEATPRKVLKSAYASGFLSEGQVWIDMLDQRNLLSHTYDRKDFEDATMAVFSKYLPAIAALRDKLSKEL
jgi:nucleotidyltransferase substrate binding protein (TIGR01987 family)